MVVEVTLYDRAEPLPCLRYRIVHASSELVLYFFQLGGHALGDRLSLEGELPILGLPVYMRESQEPERSGFTFSSLLPIELGESSELNQSRLVRVKLQPKLLQPLCNMVSEAFCIGLV